MKIHHRQLVSSKTMRPMLNDIKVRMPDFFFEVDITIELPGLD